MKPLRYVEAFIPIALPIALTIASGFPEERQRTDGTGVYILGALHGLHETEEAFGYDDLRRIIVAIRPEIMLLEVRPDELAERKDTPGRPEYPRVVWPVLGGFDGTAIALEPGAWLFAQLTGEASHASKAFSERDPERARRWSSYQKALDTVLRAHWRHPADAHDSTTAELSRSYYVVQHALVGDALKTVQDRWDEFMTDRAREAVRSSPGKRILLLCSYRNRHRFEDALRTEAPERLVDIEAWLRGNFNLK